jgi:Cu-processing system permease protein
MRDILNFAELTLREARRRKIVWTAIGLGIAFVALYGVGFFFIYRDMMRYRGTVEIVSDAGFNFVVMAGLYAVSFMGVMLAVLVSVGAIAGEVSSHTVQALAVKPYRRSAIILGKWLGLALMLAVYIVLLGAGVMAVTWAISGYLPPSAVEGLLLIALQAVIMLSVSLLGGTRLSTVANGVTAFMLYGLAFVGGWIEQFGALAHNETAVDIGILSSLLVPSEAMWKMASYRMQPPVTQMFGISPFSMSIAPSPAMLIYALVYMAAAVVLAVYSFEHCDL